jgi:hypothetical protein
LQLGLPLSFIGQIDVCAESVIKKENTNVRQNRQNYCQ